MNTPSEPPPNPELEQLQKFNTEILDRHELVEKMFEGRKISPVKKPEFKKVVEDHLSIVNSWFILTGKFSTNPGEDKSSADPSKDKADKLREQGFAVSGSGPESGLDPLLLGNPAVAHALSFGASLTDDSDDEAEDAKVVVPPPTK